MASHYVQFQDLEHFAKIAKMRKLFLKIGLLILLAFAFSVLSMRIESVDWDVVGTECFSNTNRPAPYDHFCWEPVSVHGYPLPYLYPYIGSSASSTVEFRPFIFDAFFYFVLLYTFVGLFLECRTIRTKKGTRST